MQEAEAFWEQVSWAKALLPRATTWQEQDYHAIEAFRRWKEVSRVTSEEVLERLAAVGVKIKPGTLRAWPSQGLIPGPRRYPRPDGGRGMLADWREEAVMAAAAVWALRNLPMPTKWARPTPDGIKEARRVGESFLRTFRVDPRALDKISSDGYWGGSQELHALVVRWLAAALKAQAGWPVDKPAKVVILWTASGRQDNGTLKWRFEGVSVTPSEEDRVSVSWRRAD